MKTPLTIAVILLVCIICLYIIVKPEESIRLGSDILHWLTRIFGSGVLCFTFLCFIFCIWLFASRYGNIRLGAEKPEFSRMKYFAMVFSAGYGAATLYWAFLDSIYYYCDPPFNIAPQTAEAAEWALPYVFHHWGLPVWGLFTVVAIPMCYNFYVKKNRDLNMGAVCKSFFGEKIISKPVEGVINFLFMFMIIGALSMSVALSTPVLSQGLASVFSTRDSFALSAILVGLMAIICIVSAYVGIHKGMQTISSINVYLFFALVAFIFIAGPTQFIIDNTTGAIGRSLQNFINMSLWTDPIQKGEFPQIWTVFYFCYWLIFAPGLGVFITRIANGQRFKDIVFLTLCGGTLGTVVFMGTMQSYTMNLQLTGVLDAARYITSGKPEILIIEILKTLPMPTMCIFVYIISSVLFCATTLDGYAYSLAAVACRKLDKNNDPPRAFRIFWCIVLIMLPLTLIYLGSPLDVIKSISIVTGLPFIVIVAALLISFIRRVDKDRAK